MVGRPKQRPIEANEKVKETCTITDVINKIIYLAQFGLKKNIVQKPSRKELTRTIPSSLEYFPPLNSFPIFSPKKN